MILYDNRRIIHFKGKECVSLKEQKLDKSAQEQIQDKKEGRKQVLRYLLKWLAAAVLLAVLLLNLFTHVFQIVRYNGTGMEPGLQGGQMLMILKTQKVQQGDVIAFYYNNQILIRRLICPGGDQIEIDEHGVVSVNGVIIDEPYLKNTTLGQSNITYPYHVRTGTVFVMGDNREEAMDSRLEEIGAVPEDRIIGKVIFKF